MSKRINQWIMLVAIGTASVAGAFGSARGVVAQDAASAWGVVVPNPALCQVEPRTFDEFMAVFANATPSAEPVAEAYLQAPTGAIGSAALTEEITAALHEAFACLNAGDWLRFFCAPD